MKDKTCTLERLSYFKQFYPISEQDYSVLKAKMRPHSQNKGNLLVRQGEVPKGIYLVKKGVQMSYFESDSKINVIAFTYPPNLCTIPGAVSFQTPSAYSLVCLSDSEFDFISLTDLLEVMDKSPVLERLFRLMTEAVLANFITRHIELHTMSIRERYLSFCGRSTHLLQKVPHKYIASYLGIDPTNFSKLFNSVAF